jgi:hypothetical protein
VHAVTAQRVRFRCPVTGRLQEEPVGGVSVPRAVRELTVDGATTVDAWLAGNERFVDPSAPRTIDRRFDAEPEAPAIDELVQRATETWRLHEETRTLLDDVLGLATDRQERPDGWHLELHLAENAGPRRCRISIRTR